jgi:hypothetical protein
MKLNLLLMIILITGLISGCNVPKDIISESPNNSSVNINSDVEKIEVYHFHGASQCFSCRTIKEFAEKTVNTYYPYLVESGKMEFRSINVELPENKEVSQKYGATGSSLWIGTYIDGEFHKEQNINVWYKVRDEADFTSYLKGFLDKRLSGDLS